jgi:hypothetical protein
MVIRADVTDAGPDLGSQTVETPQQCRLAPVVADPQQAGQVLINLVNQGPKHSAHAHGDFVDTNGLDVFQLPVWEAILDDPLNRGIHVCPGYMEAVGCFVPGKFARPTGQEQPKAVTQTVFPRTLRTFGDFCALRVLSYCYGWEWLRLRYGSVLLEWSLFDLGWNDWGYQVDEAAHFRRMIL